MVQNILSIIDQVFPILSSLNKYIVFIYFSSILYFYTYNKSIQFIQNTHMIKTSIPTSNFKHPSLMDILSQHNVYLLDELELQASGYLEKIYSIINTPANINPIKDIINSLNDLVFKVKPVYKELQIERIFEFWKKIIKSMNGLNVELLRIIQLNKNFITKQKPEKSPSKDIQIEVYHAPEKKQEEINSEDYSEVKRKTRRLGGISLFEENYLRGIQRTQINNKEGYVENTKEDDKDSIHDLQTFRSKILKNIMNEFAKIDSCLFEQEADDVRIYITLLKKKMQTFNHISHAEDLQEIMDFFRRTHMETLDFLKKTALSGDIANYQFNLETALTEIKKTFIIQNEKISTHFKVILHKIQQKTTETQSVFKNKIHEIQVQLMKFNCKKADIGVETNVKQIKKLKYYEKVIEQKTFQLENITSEMVKKYKKLLDDLEVQIGSLKKINKNLKAQVERGEQKKAEAENTVKVLQRQISELKLQINSLSIQKNTIDQDVQVEIQLLEKARKLLKTKKLKTKTSILADKISFQSKLNEMMEKSSLDIPHEKKEGDILKEGENGEIQIFQLEKPKQSSENNKNQSLENAKKENHQQTLQIQTGNQNEIKQNASQQIHTSNSAQDVLNAQQIKENLKFILESEKNIRKKFSIHSEFSLKINSKNSLHSGSKTINVPRSSRFKLKNTETVYDTNDDTSFLPNIFDKKKINSLETKQVNEGSPMQFAFETLEKGDHPGYKSQNKINEPDHFQFKHRNSFHNNNTRKIPGVTEVNNMLKYRKKSMKKLIKRLKNSEEIEKIFNRSIEKQNLAGNTTDLIHQDRHETKLAKERGTELNLDKWKKRFHNDSNPKLRKDKTSFFSFHNSRKESDAKKLPLPFVSSKPIQRRG